MSSVLSFASSSLTSSVGPEATHSVGELIAAMLRPTGSRSRSSASPSETLSMEPDGSVSNSRPRSATIARPSCMLMTPERQAATYSPALCPMSAAGSTPHDASSLAVANSVANKAGRATLGRSRAALALSVSSVENSTLRRSSPSCGEMKSQHASTAAR